MDTTLLIFIGGILHLGILLASAAVPQALDWRKSLQGLDQLLRQLIWVHGAFIVLVSVGFGVLSIALPHELASGTPLARGVCAFISLFWASRLAVQFFVFDAKAHLSSALLKVGYHGLTIVFVYQSLAYGLAAFAP